MSPTKMTDDKNMTQWCAVATFLVTLALSIPAQAQEKIKVVTTLTTYADIVRQIGGNRVDVIPLADGRENIHHVQPKPSLVIHMKRADMLVTTGLDLEMWLPPLMDKANNPDIASGTLGFVAVAPGINLLDAPQTLSHSEGDTHKFGNHHIWTEPANALIIGRNILTGLTRLDPDNDTYYEQRYAAWKEVVMRAYVGDELLELLGLDLVADLDREGELWSFLSAQSFQGRPLTERVGGWLGQMMPYRDQEMICYHKQWSYFTRSFGVSCAEYVEPKPGIPPSPKHVARVINTISDRNIPVLLAVNYYDRDQTEMVAERTGATAVIIPMNVDGGPHTETFVELMTLWVNRLAAAFAEQSTVTRP